MSNEPYAPIKVDLVKDKRYAWCTCSHSEQQPFCDGSHRAHDKPGALGFTAEEAKEAWLCTCKQTGNPPFCDGSHNSLI
ncbi:CDGSH iron-sulfur domain-containing protein [Flavobacteriaceae bacterium TP-CH-4]|uniref:CDGSH iron-sulfur domain-containing protein n=1 Tax=Pelagihabitans pacificus TaxID=2696054 RepID=A0A967AV99_9FLAO|nr:CDGSH iron-sulfur domain-containing protein [Pelagihabitans pacificus]NHF59815.1 CDGSH iron-sulfur domain-containing protein [Pelagihabitans pacificus]